MRTTVTLDDDVAERLQEEMRSRRNNGFKKKLNDVLRQGLRARRELTSAEPFKVRPRSLGSRPGLSYDNIGELLEQVEGHRHG